MPKSHTGPKAHSDARQATIKVKLAPRSSKNMVAGREVDTYRVKVSAPPVDGAANAALVYLLSKTLGIPKGSIEIVSGKKSRVKSLRIRGLSLDEVTLLLEEDHAMP